jgi:hypothetical protein
MFYPKDKYPRLHEQLEISCAEKEKPASGGLSELFAGEDLE